MKISLDDTRVELARNQILTIEGGLGMRVSCARGSIWVTQNHDRRDVILAPGDSFTIDRDGMALVSAMAPSTVVMEVPGSAQVEVASGVLAALGKRLGRSLASLMTPARHPAVELRGY